jgi:uncharacterized protein (DUF302 family)
MESDYTRKIKKPFEEVVDEVTAGLQKQGFGIITTIDLKDTLKNKLGIDFRKYKILGACNPEFAYKVVSLESHMGLMLPCNVLVQEHENGEVEVSAINPLQQLKESTNPDIEAIATEVGGRLRTAIDEAV